MKIINNTTEKLADDLRVTIKKRSRVSMNCTPFVRQYDILDNKWGALL